MRSPSAISLLESKGIFFVFLSLVALAPLHTARVIEHLT